MSVWLFFVSGVVAMILLAGWAIGSALAERAEAPGRDDDNAARDSHGAQGHEGVSEGERHD